MDFFIYFQMNIYNILVYQPQLLNKVSLYYYYQIQVYHKIFIEYHNIQKQQQGHLWSKSDHF